MFNLISFWLYKFSRLENVVEQLEENSKASPALKLHLLMPNLKSFPKEDEINGVNAHQETAT